MLYCPLASGSKGNCHLIKGEDTIVLVDAGTSARNIVCQLASLGATPCDVSAILITHEHIDHIAALDVLVRKHNIPIYCNLDTARAVQKRFESLCDACFNIINPGCGFFINELEIAPFKTPHDAVASMGYSFSVGLKKITVATDIGHMTAEILDHLKGAQLVALESNHDEQMLAQGSYPFALKRRILGNNGHLSNKNCGATLARLVGNGLKQVVLCHLSQENNTPELAYNTVAQALLGAGGGDLPIDIAHQERRGAVYNII